MKGRQPPSEATVAATSLAKRSLAKGGEGFSDSRKTGKQIPLNPPFIKGETTTPNDSSLEKGWNRG
ncbi:hypothetical protein AUK40_05570 [Candidatus Wirthbacteria bacterium CG2_30_54_11]|uniref:Uncharacterized protein n=1 Tax=Candidatus Wirthbacteria bacterium CG2_30_54_11 TaxID=1817892 RepID=A0A1J5IFQ8_9BACT|nr:MAG: hypothetical protein AUK40_05570 [Candidatus Wirthbacteria bacterium CG2_30_54_11]